MLLILLINTQTVLSCANCSTEKLVEIQNNIENVSQEQISGFLSSINSDCISNIEYAEFANDLLFSLLMNRPSSMISTMTKYKGINQKLILDMVKNPISDDIDLNKIRSIIKTAKGKKSGKRILLRSLDEALTKYNSSID